MILKVIGSIIVITVSSFVGYFMSKDCSKRPLQLRALQGLIQMLESEIRFLSSYIPDAFERIYKLDDSPVTGFFVATIKNLKNDSSLSASQAWEMAISSNIYKTALNTEDMQILINFGNMLGNSDIEGQVKNISFVLTQLSIQEKKLKSLKEKTKNYIKL